MKKLFLAGLLFISLTTYAQKKDTVATKQLTDSLPLFSIKDYDNFYKTIVSKLPTETGIQIIQFWQSLLQERVQEWQKLNGKKK